MEVFATNDWIVFKTKSGDNIAQVNQIIDKGKVIRLKFLSSADDPHNELSYSIVRNRDSSTPLLRIYNERDEDTEELLVVKDIRKQDPTKYLRKKLQKIINNLNTIKKRKQLPAPLIYDLDGIFKDQRNKLMVMEKDQRINRELYLRFLKQAFKMKEVKRLKGTSRKMVYIGKMYRKMDKQGVIKFLTSSMAAPMSRHKRAKQCNINWFFLPANAAVVERAFRKNKGTVSQDIMMYQILNFKSESFRPIRLSMSNQHELKEASGVSEKLAVKDKSRSSQTQKLQAIPVVLVGRFKNDELTVKHIGVVSGGRVKPKRTAKEAGEMLMVKAKNDDSRTSHKSEIQKRVSLVQNFAPEVTVNEFDSDAFVSYCPMQESI